MSRKLENKRHEDFVQFVSSNEERVRESLCRMGEFRREAFCVKGRSTDFVRSFLWEAPRARTSMS